MKIEINVLEKQSSIVPSNLQMLRRVINVLCERGFDVDLSFIGDYDRNDNVFPHMDGAYPHNGYFIRMTKDTIQRLDAPNPKQLPPIEVQNIT